jgi:lipoprotein signal peptidase
MTRLGLFAYALATTVIVLDQISKHWVLYVHRLPERISTEVLPIFSLTMVWNRGVSFGLFQAEDWGRWLLAGFSLVVAVALAVWARKVERRLTALALGLVIGGAIGNLIDRVPLRRGRRLPRLHPPRLPVGSSTSPTAPSPSGDRAADRQPSHPRPEGRRAPPADQGAALATRLLMLYRGALRSGADGSGLPGNDQDQHPSPARRRGHSLAACNSTSKRSACPR